ncbi:MAG: DUF4270 domain-containing protein [Bacteroidetes bacterium]|nr:DUF4270 domain-containing protein [Bacteroidota bacterium]
MTKYIQHIFFLLLIAGLISSCKKKTPEDIGLAFLPEGDLLNAEFTDTATLITHTVKDDSLKTYCSVCGISPLLLGTINDPVFGITKSSVFTQLSLSKTNPSFGANPILDSAVLSLVYNSGQHYGTLYPQKFDVYEVSEPMSTTTTYYSNDTVKIYTTQQIGSATITPDLTDSLLVDTLKFPPHLRIKLSKGMFQNFLDTSSFASSYNSNSNFQSVFKGIYIKSSVVPPSGEGAILYMNLTNAYTRLTLYYKNDSDDSLSYYFNISANDCARFSHFEHDYTSSADINNQLSTAVTIQEDKVFVQPMAGVRTKITLPYIQDFFKNRKVAINKAELILPVEASSVDSIFTAHSKLVVTIADPTLGPLIMPDYFEGATYFGGDYDATNKVYKFNIARYVQQVLNGTKQNQGLYIITNSRPTTANRVQLMGGDKANSNRMRLKITYTPLE